MPKFLGEITHNGGDFALLDSLNVRGGVMQVKTLNERDSIIADKLKINTLVFVEDIDKIFRYTRLGWQPFEVSSKDISGTWPLTKIFTVNKVNDDSFIVEEEGLEEGDIILFNDTYTVIDSIVNNVITISGDTLPNIFDHVLLMGSVSNENRSVITLLEESNGVVTLSQYINKSLDNLNSLCTFKLGQGPNGKWKVFGTNVHFEGDFYDNRGRNISDLATVEYESLRREFGYDNLINNPSFIIGFNCWDTENEATYFTVAGNIILTDQMMLSSADKGVYVLVESGQTVLKMTENTTITQANDSFREIVDFTANSNTWFDVYYTYNTIEPGTLTVSMGDNTVDSFNFEVSDKGYRVHRASFKWDGTGDFTLNCTGKVKLKSLIIRPNEVKTLISTYNLQPLES